ncbi:p53-induced death domain-containing protein 1 [Erpetoichthys calabaricus]|uniref:p53-induced death domain-containing protein 1 n=1 Tax=Erpetoichthys calabaricus TaxID=27687 RepID=UPI0022342409|nr:p53-induced death domain-containing protein 1 [Erpetoichthys calabaricus]
MEESHTQINGLQKSTVLSEETSDTSLPNMDCDSQPKDDDTGDCCLLKSKNGSITKNQNIGEGSTHLPENQLNWNMDESWFNLTSDLSLLACDRVSLDMHPMGVELLQEFWKKRRDELLNVTFLSISTNQNDIKNAVALLPQMTKLRSIVLKGGRQKDEFGVCQPGLLTSLPYDFGHLQQLTFLDLSFNAMKTVPECLTALPWLSTLLLGHNEIQELPTKLDGLFKLKFLSLIKNRLHFLPINMSQLLALHTLDVSFNMLKEIPDEIGNMKELVEVDLSGNQLKTVPESLVIIKQMHKEINRLFSFNMYFPLSCKRRQSMSCLIQMVSISMPFLHPYSKSHRDVVIRTFDGSSWSDLETCILPEKTRICTRKRNSKFYLARCCVSHFSWFMVVSRLVEDHCTVPREGTLLFSSADPRIKVTFPCGATNVIRKVNMQVLTVSQQEIQNLCGDAEALASPLLCLTQNSPDNFLQPVRIQLPLPSSLKGFSLDHSRIHLFHGDPTAETWTDITQQVQLQFTHLFVIFEVTHFSWYWLWYTTKHYIGGVVRNVYKRLRLYQVRFLALQRKKDPEQILLQCLPNQKIDSAVQKLNSRYDGPEPSEIISMLEGEQFFAGFEKGIEVDSDRPDCVDGRICFVFYSQLKNMKEVFVKATLDRMQQPVKGQVSFYRGALPDSFPEEALKRRKGPDSQWLATLPICLPKLKSSQKSLLSPSNKDPLYPSLNLGNAENGYLTEANLLGIALRIGTDWRNIGINLGLSYQHLDRIQYKNRDDLGNQALEMLFTWAQNNVNSPDCINKLIEAMKDSGRKDIADEIEDIITLGKQKYFQSINRLGLEPAGSSQEDSAISMI